MKRTYLYLPDPLDRAVSQAARELHQKRSQVMREALSRGLKTMHGGKSTSAKALAKLVQQARKTNITPPLPSNLASNHNEYIWD